MSDPKTTSSATGPADMGRLADRVLATLGAAQEKLSVRASVLRDATDRLQGERRSIAEEDRALDDRAGELEQRETELAIGRHDIESARRHQEERAEELARHERSLGDARTRLDVKQQELLATQKRVEVEERTLAEQRQTLGSEKDRLSAQLREVESARAAAATIQAQLDQERGEVARARAELMQHLRAMPSQAESTITRSQRVQDTQPLPAGPAPTVPTGTATGANDELFVPAATVGPDKTGPQTNGRRPASDGDTSVTGPTTEAEPSSAAIDQFRKMRRDAKRRAMGKQ